MTEPWIGEAGRIVMGAFFLVASSVHFTEKGRHEAIAMLTECRVPLPLVAFWIGETLCIGSALLVITGYQVVLGVFGLMLFLVLVYVILLRFWQVLDPILRRGRRNAFLSNIGIFGGLLLLLQYAWR